MAGSNNGYRPLDEKYGGSYEYKQFTLASGAADYDVKAGQTALFGGSTSPFKANSANPANNADGRRVIARIIADKKLGIKFNATSNPEIIMESSESPFVEVNLLVTNIYLTNEAGADTTVGILLYK